MTQEEIITNQLSPEEAHQQRLQQLKQQKKLDKSWGIKKDEVTNPMLEINVRFMLYQQQSPWIPREYRLLQAVQDFNRWVTPLQVINRKRQMHKQTVDTSKPIAMMKHDGALIYVNENATAFDTFVFKE